MKQLKFLSIIGIAFVFLFSSCGGDETKTTDTAVTADSTSATTTTANTESTIITTPENIMHVRHKVANFSKWKTSYDEHDSMRLAGGIHSYVIGRCMDYSNMLMVPF